jgi:hypothetical protein
MITVNRSMLATGLRHSAAPTDLFLNRGIASSRLVELIELAIQVDMQRDHGAPRFSSSVDGLYGQLQARESARR